MTRENYLKVFNKEIRKLNFVFLIIGVNVSSFFIFAILSLRESVPVVIPLLISFASFIQLWLFFDINNYKHLLKHSDSKRIHNFELLILIHFIIPIGKENRKRKLTYLINRKNQEELQARILTQAGRGMRYNADYILRVQKNKGQINKPSRFCTQDVDYFVKLFNRKEPSFGKFLKEIIKDTLDKDSLCVWLHCIPRNYSLDTTKFLISCNRGDSEVSSNLLLMDEIGKDRVLKGWDDIFSNYSEKQFKRLFSVDFSTKKYIQSLSFLKNLTRKLKLFSNIRDLFDYVDKNNYALLNNLYELNQIKNFPSLKKIDNSIMNEFRFEVIKNTDELDFWGKKLMHCIRSYFSVCYKGERFLVGVYKNEKPYANIEIFQGKVFQIRGRMNNIVEENQLIEEHVNSKIANNLKI